MTSRRKFPALRIVMYPKDTNRTNKNIFGGVIMSHMDTAGAVACARICKYRVVTASFEKIDFKAAVYIGDILTLWATVTDIGRSSITTEISVEVERDGKFVQVTEGKAVYVAVDENGKSIPVLDHHGKRPRIRKTASKAPSETSNNDKAA